ncbi:hypothetical protein ATK17_0841 [Branchiibius hedensis]|uniref:Uncharacterized protein n=1 Tax=Branchiibius hedensis TaxID=672460 RepID=A0A2Y8ZUL7_9MICO|nr:hypothetical protein ATK17_0841 [Branchiibius hedensis]SSA33557.1 hypothetical protein SAMN04489750_0841 [Branchiibius hedensis]
MPTITRLIWRTAAIGRQIPRTCWVTSPEATTTVCGRPVPEGGPATGVNCPDCRAAAAFITGH